MVLELIILSALYMTFIKFILIVYRKYYKYQNESLPLIYPLTYFRSIFKTNVMFKHDQLLISNKTGNEIQFLFRKLLDP